MSGRTGDELLAEFMMERLRKQYDWNVGLNGRASMLLALTGIAFSLLVDQGFFFEAGLSLEFAARVTGLALFLVSAAVLLRAVRRRAEAVWGAADLGGFVTGCRGASAEQVSASLVDRLLDGTARNEVVLAGKSREIELGTALTLIGLVLVALGSLGDEGAIVFAAILVASLAAWFSGRLFFEAPRES